MDNRKSNRSFIIARNGLNPARSGSSNNFFVKPSTKNTQKGTGSFPKRQFNTPTDTQEKTKKPFDKKKWREQKYSLKHKLQSWDNKRKTVVLKQYYREAQKDESKPKKFDVQKIYEEASEDEDDSDNPIHRQEPSVSTTTDSLADSTKPETNKSKIYKKTQMELQRFQQAKQLKREEFLKKKAEREEARKERLKVKTEKHKKLNQRTRRGQPIMKNKLEYLLEQIQKSVAEES